MRATAGRCRWALATVLSLWAGAALAQAPKATAETDALERYWEHYELGYTTHSGLMFNVRFSPYIDAIGARLHYESRGLGRLLFRGLTSIPGIGRIGFLDPPQPRVTEGWVGMAHLLFLETDVLGGHLRLGPGVGDKFRRVRTARLNYGRSWTLAAGVLGQAAFALGTNWLLTLDAAWDIAGGDLGVAFEDQPGRETAELDSRYLSFQDVRLRLELQWGPSLALGALYERVLPRQALPALGPHQEDELGDYSQVSVYASFRTPAIASLFDWQAVPPEQTAPTAPLAPEVEALPDFLLVFSFSGGGAWPIGTDAEDAFASDQGRLITGSADTPYERVPVKRRGQYALGLSYFSPAQFYLGGSFNVWGSQGDVDTRYIYQTPSGERALDVWKFGFGIGVRGGYYLPLGFGAMAYTGLGVGVAALRFSANSRTCTTVDSSQRGFDSPCGAGSQVYGNNGQVAPWIQPHIGVAWTWDKLSAKVDVPDNARKVSVGGGLNLSAQLQWNQFFNDKALRADYSVVETAAGDEVSVAMSGPAFMLSLGWSFSVGEAE